MNQFVIIISTVITVSNELYQMQRILGGFRNILTWSCDLNDEDNVLRIVSTEDISALLIVELQKAGVMSIVMGVFNTENDIFFRENR